MSWTRQELDGLIACPQCDLLHRVPEVAEGAKARCARCGTVLIAPGANALARVLALAVTGTVFMITAVFFPFLELSVAGRTLDASLFSAVLAFAEGWMVPLAIAVGAMIVGLPLTRLLAVIWTLTPLVAGQGPWPGAAQAFRMAEFLRPWAMAEIFILGVAVALVKVAGLATLSFGPAFWAFVGLVIVMALKDALTDRHTVWDAIETGRRNARRARRVTA